MENIFYSPYKAVHHPGKIEQLKIGEISSPTCVQIDLTNKCNHNCAYCIFKVYKNMGLSSTFNGHDFIPLKDMTRILNELKEVGVPAIEYTGGGEPQFHPDFTKILEETVNRDFEWALVTNGAVNDLDRNLKYFKKATWVRVSVDASCAETHALMHGASVHDFNKILLFIKTLVKECPKTVIGISFIISPINYREIVSATKLFKDFGCSNIRLSLVYTTEGLSLFKDQWKQIIELVKTAKKLETNKFKVFNLVNFSANNMVNFNRNYGFCGYQHFITSIGADGNVYPCCTLRYDDDTSLGNLANQSFKDIWFGEKHKKWLKSNYLKEKCSHHFCLMDSKNEFIEYLTMSNPPHVNYI